MEITLTEKQQQLVEQLGVMHEKSGMQPAPARVLSLLLIADEPELTFDQVREVLGLSKSATSNAINLLLTTQKIEYTTKTGDRKRYFKNRISHWKEMIKQNNQGISIMSELLKQVLHQRPGSTTEINNSLKELIDFLDYLTEEFPLLIEKWEQRK